jgi:hypothetical protein
MAEKPHREKVSTRIDSTTVAVIEQLAEERRTTLAHVLRVLIEDGAQEPQLGLAHGRVVVARRRRDGTGRLEQTSDSSDAGSIPGENGDPFTLFIREGANPNTGSATGNGKPISVV